MNGHKLDANGSMIKGVIFLLIIILKQLQIN